jgi:hypothetical protein
VKEAVPLISDAVPERATSMLMLAAFAALLLGHHLINPQLLATRHFLQALLA